MLLINGTRYAYNQRSEIAGLFFLNNCILTELWFFVLGKT